MSLPVGIARRALAAAIALAGCERGPETADPSNEPEAGALRPGDDVAPASAASAPFFVGKWAASHDACATAPGLADGPVIITETEFVGPGGRCRIGFAAESDEGGWRLERVCRSDGVESVDSVDVDVDGDMLRISQDGAEEAALMRCADQPAER